MRQTNAGTLWIVGLGPGSPGAMTPDAASAIDLAEIVVGYQGYLDLIADRLVGKEVVGRDLGQEIERAALALDLAGSGREVALISSGDAGVYAMGGVAFELARDRQSRVEIEVVPGITAALSASALLGAPLAHDWACISLSDLLTPWDTICERVGVATRADFVLVLYNPKSRSRDWQLGEVAKIIQGHRPGETPVGIVENAYRPGQRVEIVPLRNLADADVSMFTTVIVGSSHTFVDRGKMITPRIVRAKGTSIRKPDDQVTKHDRYDPILAESFAIIEREMGPGPSDPAERAIVKRMIHATADFDFITTTRFSSGAIESAIGALRERRSILTDVEMLQRGIRDDLAGPLYVFTRCAVRSARAQSLADRAGITRSAAGIRFLAEQFGDGVLVAIGNAPTALAETVRLIEEEGWRPGCIVGMPVGFVGVEDAKARLTAQSHVPWITTLGRKGGTPATAAAVNALMDLAR